MKRINNLDSELAYTHFLRQPMDKATKLRNCTQRQASLCEFQASQGYTVILQVKLSGSVCLACRKPWISSITKTKQPSAQKNGQSHLTNLSESQIT